MYFDALALQWEYEPQGYDLPSGPYLPDFYLLQVDLFAEVKPIVLGSHELQLSIDLAEKTGSGVLLLVGTPTAKAYQAVQYGVVGYMTEYCLTNFHGYVQSEGRFFSYPGCDCAESSHTHIGCELCSFPDSQAAANAARSARFEHDEVGAYVRRSA